MNDLDFEGTSVFINNSTTYLNINGNGHTIKNIKNDGNGIFNTINILENIKFENIEALNLSSSGIIANSVLGSSSSRFSNIMAKNLRCTTIGGGVGALFGLGSAKEIYNIFIDGLKMERSDEITSVNRSQIGLIGNGGVSNKIERVEIINFDIYGNRQSSVIYPALTYPTNLLIKDVKLFGNFYGEGFNTSNSDLGILIGYLRLNASNSLTIENILINVNNFRADNNSAGGVIGRRIYTTGSYSIKNVVAFVDNFYNENTNQVSHGMILGNGTFNDYENLYFGYNSHRNLNGEYPFARQDRTHILDFQDLKNQSFLESLNFDFENVWTIGDDGYPTLRFRFPPPVSDDLNLFLKRNGVWVQGEKVYVKIDGIWREAEKLYLKNNNLFK